MPNLDQDKRFFLAGISVLSDYLLSKEIFYPLGGDLPRLTIGNLLLAQLRLQITGNEVRDPRIDTVRAKWRVAWEQKSTREFHTRLELWKNFLSEYRASPEGNVDRFSVEVRHRVILHLLSKETDKAPEMDQLPQLDYLLRSSLLPGNFVWEKRVESSFPRSEYWFLFGHLKSK
jgi:hypothetical protein